MGLKRIHLYPIEESLIKLMYSSHAHAEPVE